MGDGTQGGAPRPGSSRPRRILALDGGGIRGILSVEVVARVEQLLRERTGDPSLLLRDWFDLIAGTSTGAITAALLATGHSSRRIRAFYREEGRRLFEPAPWWQRWRHRYDADRLTDRLRELLGPDTTLGSASVRPVLMLVLRNVTTDSPWVVTNHPGAPFNDTSASESNLALPLWRLVRASAAAPAYFEPEVFSVGDEEFVFSDGAATGLVNPAFRAFLVATLRPYGIGWRAEEDALLVVSVGTGRVELVDEQIDPEEMHLLYHAATVPRALINATRDEQDLLCRSFGACRVGEPIDREVGDMIGVAAPGGRKLFTYLRYDASLTDEGLAALGCADVEARRLATIDAVDQLPALRRIGRALADRTVRWSDFERFRA